MDNTTPSSATPLVAAPLRSTPSAATESSASVSPAAPPAVTLPPLPIPPVVHHGPPPTPSFVRGLLLAFIGWIVRILAAIIRLVFPSRLVVERVTHTIPNLPPHLHGMKIVHLTDLHYDAPFRVPRVTHALLTQALIQVNREAPDLVFITGDFVQKDHSPIDTLAPLLRTINARGGVYGVLGNHDYGHNRYSDPTGPNYIRAVLARNGVRVLVNEVVAPFGPELMIVGLDDLWSPGFTTAGIPWREDVVTLVMAHNPDTAAQLQNTRVDVQFSGHTHGGQVCLPFGMGPLIPRFKYIHDRCPSWLRAIFPGRSHFNVVKHWEWCSGLHTLPRLGRPGQLNRLYTSRGLATHPPLRLFCPPEVTVHVLQPAKQATNV